MAKMFDHLYRLISKAFRNDRYGFQKELRMIQKKLNESNEPTDSKKIKLKLSQLEKKIRTSVKKRYLRQQKIPKITYPENLPIIQRKDDIIHAIKSHQVVIISGETGSGKTTQIPKFCLDAGRGIDGLIGCTQPRRIAAITVAQRIAEELGEQVGNSVGYKIRFSDKTSENSYIKIMTDGILLAETQNSPFLTDYDVIIVDEAHERSLNIDFVLGILRTLIKKRKDLKLIITSATLDTEKFSNAFDQAPIIEVSGKLYPVEVRYSNPEHIIPSGEELTTVEMAVHAVDKIIQENPYGGDILIFLPTEQDIRDTCELLEGRNYVGTTILPLFARLSSSDQLQVFSNTSRRKIIASTNIAETSITIPGIQYVVDSGLARICQYVPRTRTTTLPVVPISRSSADQRKGRCGRVRNGICIRLYSEQDYLSRPLFTPPEILRSNLAEVILRMISLRLGNATEFPFIDKPAEKSIRDGYDLLIELGAIYVNPSPASGHDRYLLTDHGKLMAQLPIDPRLSRMLIQAKVEGCIPEMAVIVSALSIQDPRERPADKEAEADQAHLKFIDNRSDFITLLNIWRSYHQVLQEKSTNKLKRFCKDNYLSFRRMREWRDVHLQLIEILEENDYHISLNDIPKYPITDALYASIHRSILTGFLSNIAVKKDKYLYRAAKDREVMIFPGSGLFQHGGEWIVAAEIVETTRLFARTVANIQVEWLEELGKNLCKYSYSHPHWERNRGEVIAYEQVTLFGLPIVTQRPVSYGNIDPDLACEIFIRSALVNRDVKKSFPFMRHNQELIQKVEDMENKIRRRDIRVTDDELYDFYYQRLAGVYSIQTLQQKIRKQGNDQFLRMTMDDLLRYCPDTDELNQFPDYLCVGGHELKCTYQFKPGSDDDGVTVVVPVGTIQSVSDQNLEWGVPGLLKEKIVSLIKSLPKEYRKKLLPVTTTAEIILSEMPKENIPLVSALRKFIYQRFNIDIPASAWMPENIPDYLKLRISVLGQDGTIIYTGRDKIQLSDDISKSMESTLLESAKKKWERTGIENWDFGDLPDAVVLDGSNGSKWELFIGLKPEENSLSLRLFQKKAEAETSHRQGVCWLYSKHFSKDLKYLKKNTVLYGDLKEYASFFGGAKKLESKIYEAVVKELFMKNIRTQKEFFEYADAIAPQILKKGNEKISRISGVLKSCYETDTILQDLARSNHSNRDAIQFIHHLRQELKTLVPDNFMERYPTDQMDHIARYVKAIAIRAQRGLVYPDKDQIRAKEVAKYTEKFKQLKNYNTSMLSAQEKESIEQFFWMLEEFKVSVFAQELKTAFPVSSKRLNEKLKEIERMIPIQ